MGFRYTNLKFLKILFILAGVFASLSSLSATGLCKREDITEDAAGLAYHGRSKEYSNLKLFDRAAKAFEKVINSYPRVQVPYTNLGLVYRVLKNQKIARNL